MLKKEVRKLYREKRQALSERELLKLDDLLLIQFQRLDLPMIETVFSYFPIADNKEPAVDNIIEFCKFRNPELRICFPKINFSTQQMNAYLVKEDTAFVTGEFAIPEPDSNEKIEPNQMDLVIVPLLAFDKKGQRVGYGKGFYDKYLAQCRTDCFKVGLSYFEPLELLTDSNHFDVPLNRVITPATIYAF